MWKVTLALIALVVFLSIGSKITTGAGPIPSPTPGLEAMSIYQIDNPNTSAITVTHLFTNAQATPVYQFSSTVEVSAQYHVKDMPQIPYQWVGQVTLESDRPFEANIVGYDYVPTPTPTHTVILLPIVK